MISSRSKRAFSFMSAPPTPWDYNIKAILLGDLGVGKTTFINSLKRQTATGTAPTSSQPPRISFSQSVPHQSIRNGIVPSAYTDKVIRYHDKRVKVTIWDTAGQERYRTLTSSYYRDALACLLMYDVSSKESFENLTGWLESVREYRSGSDVVVIIVGLRKGKNPYEQKVDGQKAQLFASHHQVSHCEADFLEPESLNSVVETLVSLVMTKATVSAPVTEAIKPQHKILQQSGKPGCFPCCS